MKWLVLVSLLCVPIVAQKKIIGGSDASIEDIPYLLSLASNGFPSCGAVLVTETFALTSGWCLDGFNETELQVRAGSTSSVDGGQVTGIKSFTYHPLYESLRVDYDVGVLELAEPLLVGQAVATIPVAETEPPAGTEVQISGWGLTTSGGGFTDTLKAATVHLVDRATCQGSYTDWGTITNRLICTTAENHVDSCIFDQGGPLTFNGTVVGLVSWKISGCDEGVPSVNTNLAHPAIRSFIKDMTGV